jgi:hypothetical protein
MNQHLKFGILFAFMGVVTFLSCFYGGGTTVSFYLFHGNIYILPIIATIFVVTLSVVLYLLSLFWAPIALDFIIEISQEIWDDYRKGQAEKEAKKSAELKNKVW